MMLSTRNLSRRIAHIDPADSFTFQYKGKPAVKKPLISCIVPVLNGERYLRGALDSILAQTYRPLEIIVADDGSTDRTALQRNMAKGIPRVRRELGALFLCLFKDYGSESGMDENTMFFDAGASTGLVEDDDMV